MIQFSMEQFYVLGNHDVKFGENRITFEPCPHIKSALEIHVSSYKWLKNIVIMMKFGMNMCIFNPYHIKKFCYDRSIIAFRSKIGLLKKICLAIIIGLKILLFRWNSTWTYLIWLRIIWNLLWSDHKWPLGTTYGPLRKSNIYLILL